MSFDKEIFGNKKFSDILKDIYENQKKKDRQINLLIADIKPLIQNVSDAITLIPIIKDYMEVAVKNDEHLLKMAAVIQRGIGNGADDQSSFLTEEEKNALLNEIKSIHQETEETQIDDEKKFTKNDTEW
jgi:hypothetical protein